jgi:hypothetical protein
MISSEPNEYMAFGLSKDDSKSVMVNADAVVAWVKPNGEGKAVDYHLGSKEQVNRLRLEKERMQLMKANLMIRLVCWN